MHISCIFLAYFLHISCIFMHIPGIFLAYFCISGAYQVHIRCIFVYICCIFLAYFLHICAYVCAFLAYFLHISAYQVHIRCIFMHISAYSFIYLQGCRVSALAQLAQPSNAWHSKAATCHPTIAQSIPSVARTMIAPAGTPNSS